MPSLHTVLEIELSGMHGIQIHVLFHQLQYEGRALMHLNNFTLIFC